MTLEELMDPATCAGCHGEHYEQWLGSMHAYASHDPVFLAMNARGQRETDGALGDFCVNCHAPMAVLTGATKDGLNLDELPDHLRGVTCYFCHNVEAVEGTHNNPLVLANDGVMRGGVDAPVPNTAHRSAYSSLHDRGHRDSSAMCGSCHDVVVPDFTGAGPVHLEQTYREWQESLFSSDDPTQRLSCQSCHMPGRAGVVAEGFDTGDRRVHDHSMPGVDVALTPWPHREAQRARVAELLDLSVLPGMCVYIRPSGTEIRLTLESIAAGHGFPSGAAHDRRVWVELRATREDETLYELGVVPEGVSAREVMDGTDAWMMNDRAFKADGTDAHMFWEIAGVERGALPAPTSLDPLDPIWIDPHITTSWVLDAQWPDTVEVVLHVRPMGLEVLEDLVASGDLDPAVIGEMPTFTLELTRLRWEVASGQLCVP